MAIDQGEQVTPKELEKVLFPQRVRQRFETEKSFPGMLNTFSRELVYSNAQSQGELFDSYRHGAQILRMARLNGRVAPFMDGTVVSGLRGAYEKVAPHMTERQLPFLPYVREQANHETTNVNGPTQEEYREIINQLSLLAREVRNDSQIAYRKWLKMPVSDEEERLYQKYLKQKQDVLNTMYAFPATSLQYAFDHAGLGWLWGMSETTPLNNNRSEGGRIGDEQSQDWAEY